jgi:hypothetical protein
VPTLNPIRHTPPLTVDPSRHVGYAARNPIPATLWLLLILLALWAARRGSLPTASQAATLGGAAFVVALSAAFAPVLVTGILGAALVAAVLTNVPVVTGLLDRGSAALGKL